MRISQNRMGFPVLVLILAISFLQPGIHGSCPSGMIYNSELHACYKKVSAVMTWDAAQAHCGSLAHGGHLVEITSQGKQDYVEQVMAGSQTWFGGHRVQNGGVKDFEWSYSKIPISGYKNWGFAQPDNKSYPPLANSNCIIGYYWSGFKWYDRGCSHKAPFLCEKYFTPDKCPSGMTFNADFDACYKKVSDLMTWNEAQAHCGSLTSGGHLVEVTSQGKQNYVKQIMTGSQTWFGGHRVQNGGVTDFEWSYSKIPINGYKNWGSAQPDNKSYLPPANPNCILGYPNSFTWYDRGCGHKAPFLCESGKV